MLSIDVTGADETLARLTAAPAAIQAALRAKAADLAERLRRHVVDDKLSGQVLQARSGALRDSIAAEVSAEGDGFTATVFSTGDVKYAAIQEYGGKTPAHLIVPSKAKALAFTIGGGTVFASRVNHPGSQIPARSYLRSALADMAGDITGELKAAAVSALGGGD